MCVCVCVCTRQFVDFTTNHHVCPRYQHNGLLLPSGVPELRVEKPIAVEMGYKCTCTCMYYLPNMNPYVQWRWVTSCVCVCVCVCVYCACAHSVVKKVS